MNFAFTERVQEVKRWVLESFSDEKRKNNILDKLYSKVSSHYIGVKIRES